MTVAGFGDAALTTGRAAGGLGRGETDEGGELARIVEAGEIAELRDDGERDGILHAAKRLNRIDDRR